MHGRTRERPQAEEAERYRTAAEATLGQLDWVMNYIRKKRPRLAAALRRNRDQIAKRLD
jgi:hypothetical protein